MRAYIAGHAGPVHVRSENLLRRRPRRNLWTWLALFPLLAMWLTARWMGIGLWRAVVWTARRVRVR